ncbi:MAG: hypothetical protein IIT71_05430 [Acetobacter sp.]|nr:hypothetical protein [Acetobacter sp.]MBO6085521.1 hypothetical protein [Acetobacter sp.]MBQ3818032.1 hypothetical protein [Acetobacter sp.]MBQ5497982.1 hypothetical protein [Acetobacter sp.]MBQ5546734.1 hypothetical protein [Acetobacter sp.]
MPNNNSPQDQDQDKELLNMFNETGTDPHKEILQRLEDAEKRIDDMEKTITMLFTMIREIGDFQVKNEKLEPSL